jgi:hypothetical protein
MFALILAAALNSAPVSDVEHAAMTAFYEFQGARAERAALGAWLDEQDVVRAHAIDRRANPFADDPKASPFAEDAKPDPFDGPPRLFWWSTGEAKTERW